jgi:hypothetical protein
MAEKVDYYNFMRFQVFFGGFDFFRKNLFDWWRE